MNLTEAVDALRAAPSREEAERARWSLESRYLPNQVLREGAASLGALLFDQLPAAETPAVVEMWELLAQLASACVGVTAADSKTVVLMRAALENGIPRVTSELESTDNIAYVGLVVDVADAMLEFVGAHDRERLVTALTTYAGRGVDELRRVRLILPGDADDLEPGPGGH